jgi:1-acyl-sn-glycerol-3-phosphate acyltransferase
VLSETLYWVTRPAIGLYGRMLKLNVGRHERLPKGPKIYTANHPSTSDPFLVSMAVREPAKVLVINHAFRVPLFGTFLHASGHIPVDPHNGRAAFDAAERHLRDGGSVIIFPEGHLSPRQGGFFTPRTGAARLALITGAPVIPIGISLSPRGLWHIESDMDSQWVASRYALRGPYGITIGRPSHFQGDIESRDHVRLVTRRIMQSISELAHESQERLQAPFLWPSILELPVPA